MIKNNIFLELLSLILFLTPITGFSRTTTYEHLAQLPEISYVPWFTGSILPPSAVNAAPGHPIIAPIFAVTNTYGEYKDNWKLKGTTNTWGITPYLELLFGINNYIGIDIYVSSISNFKKGQNSTHLQDTIAMLGFQIAKDKPHTWIPDIRFLIQETFPTGSYQKLNPKKNGIDSTGLGSFQTGFNFIIQKLFSIQNHFIKLKWTFNYLFPAPVHVKRFNAYGGGYGASGKVFPGQIAMFYFSGEYSLNQKWVLTFDTVFEYQGKSRFSGNPGSMKNGLEASVGKPLMLQFSFAPQIEYNLSPSSGLLFGSWLTLFGKNSPAFATILGACYFTF